MKRRNTPGKTAVLSALQKAGSALSHDQVANQLAGTMDRATVYRILNRFCTDGITHRIVGDDGKRYFALCQSCEHDEHHHDHFHFHCRSCGQVECLTSEISVSLPTGYRAEQFNGVIGGQCAGCAG